MDAGHIYFHGVILLKILCLHPAVSMRTIRQMKVLKSMGHEIHLKHFGYGISGSNEKDKGIWASREQIFSSSKRWSHYFRTLSPTPYKQLVESAKEEGFDIIHSVSMSDVLGAAAVRYSKGVPVLFDIRELVTAYEDTHIMNNYIPPFLRTNAVYSTLGSYFLRRIRSLEREAIEGANARLFVSDYTYELAKDKYNFNHKSSKVFYNYIATEDIPTKKKRKISEDDGETHIAYSSGLSLNDYRGQVPLFLKCLAKQNLHVHIHGVFADDATKKCYMELARTPRIHLEKTLPPTDLIRELTRYDYGLIYYQNRAQNTMLDTSLPNKLFEYLAAGLPVLVSPFKSLSMFVEKFKVGVTYSSEKDLRTKLENIDQFKVRPEDFTIEAHIKDLEGLYKHMLR